jgi:Arc/MetJ-type ribon-helix-helix transcriptional regulator
VKGVARVKVVQVEIPDKVASELDMLIKDGWFTSEAEIVRLALVEFVHRHSFALMEQFQRDDIAWALQHKKAKR